MRARHLFLAILLLLGSLPASAAVTRNLYEASVPVSDQGSDTRAGALRRAFETVLIRVTGSRNVPNEAAALLPRASDYLQGYGYETATGGTGLKLKAQFDARAIEAALRSAGVPVWTGARPYHLAWIAVQGGTPPRELLNMESERGAIVMAVAEGRGIPLNLPASDASLGFSKVWDNDFPAVRVASDRYAADALVVGRVAREGGGWVGRWTLLQNGTPVEDWVETAPTLDAALIAGIDALADRQASRYSVQTGRGQELRMTVSGVNSVADYGRVMNYVKGLSAVRGTAVEAADQDRLTLRLRIEGDSAGLARAIGGSGVLKPDPAPPSAVDLAYTLNTR